MDFRRFWRVNACQCLVNALSMPCQCLSMPCQCLSMPCQCLVNALSMPCQCLDNACQCLVNVLSMPVNACQCPCQCPKSTISHAFLDITMHTALNFIDFHDFHVILTEFHRFSLSWSLLCVLQTTNKPYYIGREEHMFHQPAT